MRGIRSTLAPARLDLNWIQDRALVIRPMRPQSWDRDYLEPTVCVAHSEFHRLGPEVAFLRSRSRSDATRPDTRFMRSRATTPARSRLRNARRKMGLTILGGGVASTCTPQLQTKRASMFSKIAGAILAVVAFSMTPGHAYACCYSSCASPPWNDPAQCSCCCTSSATCGTCCLTWPAGGSTRQKCESYCAAQFPIG